MYADDICLMAPSPAALQKLINICYNFSVQNNLSFNSSNSFCMVFKPRLYKLSCPTFSMNTERLDYTDSIKYLNSLLLNYAEWLLGFNSSSESGLTYSSKCVKEFWTFRSYLIYIFIFI